MARNRKRAKERRSRRPETGPGSRPGLATARQLDDHELDAPSPLEHATPDVELADAQLALGRPELAEGADAGPEPEDYDDGSEFEDGGFDVAAAGGRGGGFRSGRGGLSSGGGGLGSGGGELVAHGGEAPAHRALPGNRLINFLQGSWRELQRVQWPDRRQVIQATGVVIGFVIVAGVYLGVADSLASRLVNFVLK